MASGLIDLAFPLGWPRTAFHCPACGVETLSQSRSDVSVCDHLIYVYQYDDNGFEWCDALYAKVFEKVRGELNEREETGEEGVCDEDVLEEIFSRLGTRSKTFLGFRVTASGFGGDAMSQTMGLAYSLTTEKIVSADEAPVTD
jgi:hypothetical protein